MQKFIGMLQLKFLSTFLLILTQPNSNPYSRTNPKADSNPNLHVTQTLILILKKENKKCADKYAHFCSYPPLKRKIFR